MIVHKIFDIINYIIPKNKNIILFHSSFEFGDSARSLYEYLKKNNYHKNYKLIWLVNNPNNFKDTEVAKFYKKRSIRGIFYYYRAKYIIRTHSLFTNNYVKKRQHMICCFHGMPLKGLTKKEKMLKRNNPCDILTVTSERFKDIMSEFMCVDKKYIYPIGLPRNDDLFFNGNIINLLNLNAYKKIIIWMPTFRRTAFKKNNYFDGNANEFGIPILNGKNIKDLDEYLQTKNICLIFKLHPWAAEQMIDLSNYSNIKNLKNSDIPNGYTLYNLLGASDAMITDYSSVYVDYLNINKPIGFAFDDFEEYNADRGFTFEPIIDYLAGQQIKHIDDLYSFIDSIYNDEDKFIDARKRINEVFNKYNDDNSCKRLLEIMKLRSDSKE